MNVLITGGSRGIGAACAKLFASKGWCVALNYIKNDDAADRVRNDILQMGGSVALIKGDVSDPQQAKAVVQAAQQEYGFLDVLINNAGICKSGLLTDLDGEDWDRVFAVNVKGAFHCTKNVLPQMIHEKRGRIICISSMWGQTGASCEVAYSASKAALIGFTKALAKEVGPSGITVNCISPGVIDTDMNAEYDSKTMDALREETPLGRVGTGADVAKAALFLAGEGGSFITGQVLGVNGGFLI